MVEVDSGAHSILFGHTTANAGRAGMFGSFRLSIYNPGVNGQMKSAEVYMTFNPDPVAGSGGSSFTLATWGSAWWTGTAPITEIKVFPETNAFLAGSRAVLLGN